MKLTEVASGEKLDARVDRLSEKDHKWVSKSSEFTFDWTTEASFEVYKIFLLEDELNILGMMSLIDRPDEYRIHLNLLEVSKANQGRNKRFGQIAGCLIASAVEKSFKRGYFGFVSLEPKTLLISHYCNKYGFQQYGRYLGIEGPSSQLLLEKYLGDE